MRYSCLKMVFLRLMHAHHYWAVLSRSSLAGWADHLGHASVVRAAVPAWIYARLRCRSPYGAVARSARRLLYAGLEFFCQSGLFLRPSCPRRFCLLLTRVRREPMNRCFPLRFEIVWQLTATSACSQTTVLFVSV